MSFEIKITETKIVDAEKQPEWVVIKELIDGTKEKGYSPVTACKKEVRIERFLQVIDELDIAAVIAVINNLKKEPTNETLHS
jgi:hypothetical protein